MSTGAMVIVCALSLLGRSADRFPRVELIDVRPAGVSVNADAFTRRNPDVIYVVSTSPAFQDALSAAARYGRCSGRDPLRRVASILVHEEWHLLNGPDERGAYEAQLTALAMLGAGPDSRPHHSVKRAMREVLATRPTVVGESARASR